MHDLENPGVPNPLQNFEFAGDQSTRRTPRLVGSSRRNRKEANAAAYAGGYVLPLPVLPILGGRLSS
jgi:hypothetical protein